MKMRIDTQKVSIDINNFLKRAGYGFIIDRQSGKESYIRRLGSGHYPRFHLYVNETESHAILDLHIDQQQSSISQKRHKSEYEGDRVLEELKRLKGIIDAIS
jgi:hypothetical protein